MTATGGQFGEAFYKGAGKPSGSDDLFLGVGVHSDRTDPTDYINIRLTDGNQFYSAGAINLSGGISFSGSNNQGPSGPISDPWKVILVSGSDVVGTDTNPIWVDTSPSTSATITVLTSSLTSQLLLAANPARNELLITNDSPSGLLIKFGADATSDSYTLQLQAYGLYESIRYSGRLDVVWIGTATGSVRATELT